MADVDPTGGGGGGLSDSIVLRLRYLSDLERVLERDAQRLDRAQVATLRVRADIRQAVQQVNALVADIQNTTATLKVQAVLTGNLQGQLAAAQAAAAPVPTRGSAAVGTAPAPSPGSSGVVPPPRAPLATALSGSGASNVIKTVEHLNAAGQRTVTTTEQLARGLQQVGQTRIDTRPVEQFRQEVDNAIRGLAGPLGLAAGSGNLRDQIQLLSAQRDALRNVLASSRADPQRQGVIDTPAFREAERTLESLERRIRSLQGSDLRRQVDSELDAISRRAQADLKNNLQDQERAKNIQDRTLREQRLNDLLDERDAILRRESANAERVRSRLAGQGRVDDAEQARRRRDVLDNERLSEELNRTRGDERGFAAKRERQLRQEISRTTEELNRQLTALDRRERAVHQGFRSSLRSAIPGVGLSAREEGEIREIRSQRAALLTAQSSRLGDIQTRAEGLGFASTADAAARAQGRNLTQLEKAQERLAQATNRSGHALDFHSGSMLRNAITASAWLLPMQAIFGVIHSIRTGLRDLTSVDRQFATLQAVFRGTEGGAQALRDQALDLGVAQGQLADDTLDASIRFARLGTTQAQNFRLVRDALTAQNVAEISGAEAAEFLSASYVSQGLAIAEVSRQLNRLNEISNNYNVTNKDLIAGLERVGGVGRQAGATLQLLEGFLGATTAATGRSGAELGNALKFIITRVRQPDTIADLSEGFSADLLTAGGNIKTFDEILKTLTETYRNLSRRQQAVFLQTAAGARQASRAALLFENYTQGLILASQATLDSNSAYSEQAKILDSLASRVDSLQAAWARLFVTLGDAGLTDFLGAMLDLLADSFGGIANLVGRQEINRLQRVRDSDVRRFVRISQTETNFQEGGFFRGLIDYFNPLTIFDTVQASTAELQRLLNPQEFQRLIGIPLTDEFQRKIEIELQTRGVDEASISAARFADTIAILRDQIVGVGAGQQAFQDLAARARNARQPVQDIARDFANAANILAHLDSSGALTLEIRQRGEQILGAGDNPAQREAFAQLVEEQAAALGRLRAELRATFGTEQAAAIAAIETEIAPLVARQRALTDELRNTSDEARKRELVEAIQANADPLSTLQEQLRGIRKELDPMADPIDRFTSALDEAIQRASDLGDALSEAFSQLFSRQGDDGRRLAAVQTLIANARRDVIRLEQAPQRQSLESEQARLTSRATGLARIAAIDTQLAEAQARIDFIRNVGFRVNPPSGLSERVARTASDRALQDRLLDERNRLTQEFDLGTGPLDTLRQQVEEDQRVISQHLADLESDFQAAADAIEKPDPNATRIADIRAAFERGGRDSSLVARASAVGLTEGERGISSIRASIEQLRSRTGLLQRGFGLDNDVRAAQALGGILSQEQAIQDGIGSAKERQASIQADLLNLQLRENEALEEKNRQLGRSFALAERETQLRVVAAARFFDQNGPIGLGEFSFFDQNTRRTIADFFPGQVRDGFGATPLDETRAPLETERVNLLREQRALGETIAGFSQDLGDLGQTINALLRQPALSQALTTVAAGQEQESGGQSQRAATTARDAETAAIRVHTEATTRATEATRRFAEQLENFNLGSPDSDPNTPNDDGTTPGVAQAPLAVQPQITVQVDAPNINVAVNEQFAAITESFIGLFETKMESVVASIHSRVIQAEQDANLAGQSVLGVS